MGGSVERRVVHGIPGYDGPGVSTGNNVFSIGTYSSWTYLDGRSEDSREDMWSNTDAWVNWFDSQDFSTPTEYFLYLIDESLDYAQTEQWAKWMDDNPGPGSRLPSMATISSPEDWENNTPSLDIPTSGMGMGIADLWENATARLVQDPDKRFYFYNGVRPASGTFCKEDDGVALRVNGWIQHKKRIDRWFYWESSYYDNYQAGEGETEVFSRAQACGSFDTMKAEFGHGEYGWNYTNSGIFPKIEKAAGGGTGIAFVNVENKTANVTLAASTNSGEIVATQELQLNEFQKRVEMARNLFDSDISSATCITYRSDAEAVGFQLNVDGIMLDGLPGIILIPQ